MAVEEERTKLQQSARSSIANTPSASVFRLPGPDGHTNENPKVTVVILDRFTSENGEDPNDVHGNITSKLFRDHLRVWSRRRGVEAKDVGIVAVEANSFHEMARGLEAVVELHDRGEPIVAISISRGFYLPSSNADALSDAMAEMIRDTQAEILAPYFAPLRERRIYSVISTGNAAGTELDALSLLSMADPYMLMVGASNAFVPRTNAKLWKKSNVSEVLFGVLPGYAFFFTDGEEATYVMGTSVVPPFLTSQMSIAAIEWADNRSFDVRSMDMRQVLEASMVKGENTNAQDFAANFEPNRFYGILEAATQAVGPESTFSSAIERVVASNKIPTSAKKVSLLVDDVYLVKLGEEPKKIDPANHTAFGGSDAVVLTYKRQVIDIMASEEWDQGKKDRRIEVTNQSAAGEYGVTFLSP